MEIQYFKEGEEVELLGESISSDFGSIGILLSTLNVKLFTCPHCESLLKNSTNQNAYYLSVFIDGECCIPWHQNALRKKYKPSSRSFASLMENPSS